MESESFAYTYEFLREVFKSSPSIRKLDAQAADEMLAHLDEAEKCEIPASYVAKLMKKRGWIHLCVDEHGKVTEVNENS